MLTSVVARLRRLWANIVTDFAFSEDSMAALEAKLFFEGADRRRMLERFGILLLLSAIIATAGVLADSTATVIGAMIIAPLMTPIMGTAAAIVIGDRRRALRSLTIVVTGGAGVVGLAAAFAWFYPGPTSLSNAQIASRIAPNLLDLVVALASGATGAFAMSRDDVADSLPGVAIAIALVPPLSVVGILLGAGNYAAAMGALLLFLTNFLAILLAGGGVLTALGLHAVATSGRKDLRRDQAFRVIAIGTLLVAVPLSVSSTRIATNALVEAKAHEAAEAWVGESGFQIALVRASGGGEAVTIIISGAAEPLDFEQLVTGIRGKVGRPIAVTLQTVPSLRQTTESADGTRRAGVVGSGP